MKTGMSRKIDELGRIVIPKEMRRSLNLNTGDEVEIYVEDNKVILKRSSSLLGLEEELFNICKVINEFCRATTLIIDDKKIIVSYGRFSERYLDQEVNDSFINKMEEDKICKHKNLYVISDFEETRQIYATQITTKHNFKAYLVVIENEKVITQLDIDIITQLKKFISKQLDS